MNTILIKDQTIAGKDINTITLEFKDEEITLRELISDRVTFEVEKYNEKEDKPYFGLVTPERVEAVLNKKHKPKPSRLIDVEKQIYVALDGFLKNQFFVLIDDRQIDDLEYKLQVNSITSVQFIKMTPLVGG